MALLRTRLATLLEILAVVLATAVAAPGCGTDPVNPDGCKSIENARCEAIALCPSYPDFDVAACKRFYRDQCLHGLASGSDPGEPRIDQCVRSIDGAKTCLQTAAPVCDLEVSKAVGACDVIEHPENYRECDFLIPAPIAPDAAVEATDDAEAGADAAPEVSDAEDAADAAKDTWDEPDTLSPDNDGSVDV